MKFFLGLLLCGIIVAGLPDPSPPADYSDPGHPGNCLYEGHSVNVGKHNNLDPNSCYEFVCLEGGQGTIEGCCYEDQPQKCNLGDSTEPYPKCCGR